MSTIENYIKALKNELSSLDGKDLSGKKETNQEIISNLCSIMTRFTESPQPEWFDHRCDQYFQFHVKRSSHWVERGVFGGMILKPTSDVLELCSGDGYNAYHFYSNRCNSIHCIDFDKDAHKHSVDNYGNLPNLPYW